MKQNNQNQFCQEQQYQRQSKFFEFLSCKKTDITICLNYMAQQCPDTCNFAKELNSIGIPDKSEALLRRLRENKREG